MIPGTDPLLVAALPHLCWRQTVSAAGVTDLSNSNQGGGPKQGGVLIVAASAATAAAAAAVCRSCFL
jgi:hypothetical protein